MHLNDAIQLVRTLFTPINLIGQLHFPQLIADSCSLLRGHSANAAMSPDPDTCPSSLLAPALSLCGHPPTGRHRHCPVLARLTLTTLGRVVITPDREAGNPCGLHEWSSWARGW